MFCMIVIFWRKIEFMRQLNRLKEQRGITMQIHSDKIKLRRFALHLYFAGDLRRYADEQQK